MVSRWLTLPFALLALAAAGVGCGGDDETTAAGATGATGPSSASEASADADAKSAARTAQVALETFATDNNGSDAGTDVAGLGEIQPTLSDADLTVTADAGTYAVSVTSTSGAQFSIARNEDGAVELTCEPPGTASCSESSDWD